MLSIKTDGTILVFYFSILIEKRARIIALEVIAICVKYLA